MPVGDFLFKDRKHTHRSDSPIQTVYLTSTNFLEELLRREVILKGLIPLRGQYISSYVSVSANKTMSVCVVVCVCLSLYILISHLVCGLFSSDINC